METFTTFLQLGFDHITDLNGYDHILFILALCAVYTLSDWKNVLILVTAFTVGHSITLALAALHILSFDSALIEFLIPLSILITCITNLLQANSTTRNGQVVRERKLLRYFFAVFFGLIHGMGFSNYLRSLLGNESDLFVPLFGFNLGLEFGQIIIVILVLLLAHIVIKTFKVSKRDWNLFLSSAIFGVAFIMCLEPIGSIF